MKIFLDDTRVKVKPHGWVIVRNSSDFADLCNNPPEPISEISFDHDLGNESETGHWCLHHVINCVLDHPERWTGLERIVIHSANGVGVENMIALVRNAIRDIPAFANVALHKYSQTMATGWAKEPDNIRIDLTSDHTRHAEIGLLAARLCYADPANAGCQNSICVGSCAAVVPSTKYLEQASEQIFAKYWQDHETKFSAKSLCHTTNYDNGVRVNSCHAHSDGECSWAGCPQLRDDEPAVSGRHCPLDKGCRRCGYDDDYCQC